MSIDKWFMIFCILLIIDVFMVWKYMTSDGNTTEVITKYIVQPSQPIEPTQPTQPIEPIEPIQPERPIVAYKYRVHYHCPMWRKTHWISDFNDRMAKFKMEWLARDLRSLGFNAWVRKRDIRSMPGHPRGPWDPDPSGVREVRYWVEYILRDPRYKDFAVLSRARKLEQELRNLRCNTRLEKIEIRR